MGAPDFRVNARIFATLASQHEGLGNLMLSPDQQAEFLADAPDLFLPVNGGWGRLGATHIRLAQASEDSLHGALHTAYNLRVQKNQNHQKESRSTPAPPTKRSSKEKGSR